MSSIIVTPMITIKRVLREAKLAVTDTQTIKPTFMNDHWHGGDVTSHVHYYTDDECKAIIGSSSTAATNDNEHINDIVIATIHYPRYDACYPDIWINTITISFVIPTHLAPPLPLSSLASSLSLSSLDGDTSTPSDTAVAAIGGATTRYVCRVSFEGYPLHPPMIRFIDRWPLFHDNIDNGGHVVHWPMILTNNIRKCCSDNRWSPILLFPTHIVPLLARLLMRTQPLSSQSGACTSEGCRGCQQRRRIEYEYGSEADLDDDLTLMEAHRRKQLAAVIHQSLIDNHIILPLSICDIIAFGSGAYSSIRSVFVMSTISRSRTAAHTIQARDWSRYDHILHRLRMMEHRSYYSRSEHRLYRVNAIADGSSSASNITTASSAGLTICSPSTMLIDDGIIDNHEFLYKRVIRGS